MDISSLLVMAPAAVIAVVKAVRDTFPKVDGIAVLAVGLAAGSGLSWLFSADAEPIKQVILQGVFWGLAGSGFMVAADRLSPTVTQHVTNNAPSASPPADPSP